MTLNSVLIPLDVLIYTKIPVPHLPLPLPMRCPRASIASAAGSMELVRICMLPPLRPPCSGCLGTLRPWYPARDRTQYEHPALKVSGQQIKYKSM